MSPLIPDLRSAHPDVVFTPGSKQYNESLQSYWCRQASEVNPAAILRPRTVSELCDFVKALFDFNVKLKSDSPALFAIRGGGHQSWGNAANIENGITIDLSTFNHINIEKSRQQVVVGAGCYWSNLYEKLEEQSLMVPGARVTNCGIAGLCLGGGISYFSPRMGFVCDNMLEVEIVLADGTLVTANQETNQDLFRSLKGGSNNFGIVTSITMQTFDWAGSLWGGAVIYGAEQIQGQLQSLHQVVTEGASYDANAAIIVTLGFHHQFAEMCPMGYNSLKYTQPVDKTPPFLEPFVNIPSHQNTMRKAGLKEILDEEGQSQGPGLRRLFMNVSFQSNLAVLQRSIELYEEAVNSIRQVKGIVYTIMFNPITASAIQRSIERGGNSLGHSPNKPLIVCAIAATWDEEDNDATVVSTTKELFGKIDASSKSHGVYSPYIYMNYAWEGQAVIDGYGEVSKQELRRVSTKYDEYGVFQKFVPGGFKLF